MKEQNENSGSIRRRRRPAVSCVQCRRRKVGCDKKTPCSRCVTSQVPCVYRPPASPSECVAAGQERPRSHQVAAATYRPIAVQPKLSQTTTSDTGTLASSSSLGSLVYPTTSTETRHSFHANPISKSTASTVTVPRPGPSHFVPSTGKSCCEVKSSFTKTRLIGRSHWYNCIVPLEESLRAFLGGVFREAPDSPDNLRHMMERCKTAARKMKADHMRDQSIALGLREYVPPRERCDVLVNAYFRTFETIFRVLHQPTFRREYEHYWQDPSRASETFVVTMLLVLSIGSCFHRNPDDRRAFYDYSACRWVHAAQLWISTPFEKRHLNLKGLQIHCLLLLSVQVNATGADLTWMSAGALLRAAMMIGLHREPSLFPQIPVLEAEMRRRLWATILELTVQSALDSGMSPMISVHDYDCGMPSNINDDQIDELLEALPPAKPLDVYTQTSGQLALAGHLPLRLQIVEGLNSLRSPISFPDALDMYKSLSGSCRSVSANFQAFLDGDSTSDVPAASAFQVKMLDHLSRRFLLSLHVPFALQARSDLTYYYARKVCLESSFLTLAHQDQEDGLDDYKNFQIFSRGFFKSIFLQAGFMLFVELTARLSDDDGEYSMVLDYNALYHVLEQLVETCRRRLEVGETNVKSYVIFSCALAQVEALRAGKDPACAVIDTARKTLEESLTLLHADSTTTTNEESASQSELPSETMQDLIGGIFEGNLDGTYDWGDDWLEGLEL